MFLLRATKQQPAKRVLDQQEWGVVKQTWQVRQLRIYQGNETSIAGYMTEQKGIV